MAVVGSNIKKNYFLAFRSAIADFSFASASFLHDDFSAPFILPQAALAIFSSASICFFAAFISADVIFIGAAVVAAGMVVAAGVAIVLLGVAVVFAGAVDEL
ncbi:hypothetical protein CR105_16110 [Massilia eurypsychrophila]|uniref:Uncharacterized protein n=1 Tax=Massilia eurypsychrophila TaxID=1485217 RepID=A0A2G8TCZ0_9BURK|nr:hypothetical protein CR105_16110 [Massilia eurypsychrophila]